MPFSQYSLLACKQVLNMNKCFYMQLYQELISFCICSWSYTTDIKLKYINNFLCDLYRIYLNIKDQLCNGRQHDQFSKSAGQYALPVKIMMCNRMSQVITTEMINDTRRCCNVLKYTEHLATYMPMFQVTLVFTKNPS